MSDYVYESGLSTKRRRQRRTAITLLLTLLLLFSAFWWAWSYIRDGDGATATATPTPTATQTDCEGVADPRETTVNVYNATQITGLAGRVANELTERGFTVGTVANDPLGWTVAEPAALRYGEGGRFFAETFKTIVNEPSLHPDDRSDASIDIVVGDGFTELNAVPAGLPTC